MMNWIGLLGFWILLLGLVTAVRRFAGPLGMSGEGKRKAVHIGLGLVSLSFPWVFSSWIWVALMCGLSLATLQAVRVWEKNRGFRSVLHDVDRKSLGEVYFPVAVVAVFAMAGEEAWKYVIPILILTLADAAGALIGASYGRQHFRVMTSGSKSIEGSVLVFLVAFLSVHVPLLLMTEIGRAETLLIALILALLAMLIEAVSIHGLDNLLLPLISAWLLGMYVEMDEGALLLRSGVILGLLVVIFLCKRHSSLEGGALLGGVLLGYSCYFFGGFYYLVPLLVLFGEHILARLRNRIADHARRDDLCVVLGIAVSFVPWLILATGSHGENSMPLMGLTTAAAIHLACVRYLRRLELKREQNWVHASAIAIALVMVPGFWLSFLDRGAASGGFPALLVVSGIAAALVPAGLLAFRKILGRPGIHPHNVRRWICQSAAALLLSLPVWLAYVVAIS